jgi:cytochrome c553
MKAKTNLLTVRREFPRPSSSSVRAFSTFVWFNIPPLKVFVFLILVSFLAQMFPSSTAADQLTSRGAALAHACAACHGPDGRSQGAIPSINTISQENFVAALQAFRSGERQGTVMNRIAKGLDDADIAAVAAYFLTVPQKGKP